MTVGEVHKQFALFAGLTPEEAAPWEILCRGAMTSLHGRLRPTVDAEDPATAERLVLAAASIAYYQYCLLQAGQGVHSLKVGDVQLTEGDGGVAHAAQLQRNFLEAVSDCLYPHGFAFEQVVYHEH